MNNHMSHARQTNLIQRAISLSAQGKDKNALELIQTHLGKQPRDLRALILAANFAARLENWPLAEHYFMEALTVNRSDVEALYGLSKVFKLTNRIDAAVATLTNLLQVNPGHSAALNEMGVIMAEQGHLEPALQAFETACKLDASFEMAYRNWYQVLNANARHQEAVQVAKCAIEHIAPGNRLNFKVNLISSLWLTRAFGEARELAENIISELEHSAKPEHRELLPKIVTDYGVILMDMDEPDAAKVQFEKANALAPKNIEPYVNLAKLAVYQEDLCDAIGWFDKALAIDPENSILHYHLAGFLRNAGRPDLALEHGYAALAGSPDNAQMRYALSETHFALGQLREAYKNWELRWQLKDSGSKPNLPVAEWTGTPSTGRSLLVYREQGIGDEIFFASCLPDILNRFERIVCVCQAKLKPLFARSFPKIEFRSGADALTEADIADLDWQIAIGGLLPIVRPNLESFPLHHQFLLPDPKKVDIFREQLALKHGSLVIGIAWRGRLLTLSRRALYPYLEFWQALFDIPNIIWVNLQHGEVTEELKKAEQQFGISIVNFENVDHFDDIDTSAALMKACDLVIGTDGSSALIAAAVGAPTIRLFSGYDYFNLGADHNPFFPSMTSIGRKFGESWMEPVRQAADIVRALALEAAYRKIGQG
ncbi:MAG: tetratricopeptide repeat protein [Gallionella sp.]|nr:tetratricopeptide repeat protein [Gallionella sp.]